MGLSTTVNYNNPANFTFDGAKGEVTTDAHLRKVSYPLSYDQPFDSDVGFSNIDANISEISGGSFRNLDSIPSGGRLYANYNTNENLNWLVGGGTKNGVLNNGASISGGELVLNGFHQYVSYSDLNVSLSGETIVVKMKYKPNYSGAPSENQAIIGMKKASGDSDNTVTFYHQTTGAWRLTTSDDSGAPVFTNQGFGSTLGFVSGNTYILQFVFDPNNSGVSFYIDGVQQGSTITPAARTYGDRSYLEIGINNATIDSRFSIDEYIVFNTIQPIDLLFNYPNSRFPEARATMPSALYDGLGGINSFSISDLVGSSVVRYTVNGYYWSGAWVLSNNTFTQASTKADIIANAPTHPTIGVGTSLTFDVYLQGSDVEQSITQFNSSYSGLQYTVGEGISFEINSGQLLDNVDSIAVVETKPTGTDIRYIRAVNTVKQWYSGGLWISSDGSYAQSNTLAEVLANVNDQTVTNGTSFKLIPILYTTDKVQTPTITSYVLDYDFYFTGCTPITCIVYGCIKDNSGVGVAGAKVRFNSDDYRYVSALITREVVATTDSIGRFDIPIVETVSTSTTVTITVEYKESGKNKKLIFEGITIPNQASVDLDNLLP